MPERRGDPSSGSSPAPRGREAPAPGPNGKATPTVPAARAGARTRVRLRLFGAFRELAGRGEEELALASGTTVRGLVACLRARPGMDALPAEPVAAVNLEYASLDRPLRDGDEVALIPPVAGG